MWSCVTVGIVGSRNCKNFDVFEMEKYIPADCSGIVSGGADGIDSCAERFARLKNLKFTEFVPDYQKYGKRAPLERNLLIVKNCDALLAFWNCYSRGTAHIISECIKQNVPVRIIPLADE